MKLINILAIFVYALIFILLGSMLITLSIYQSPMQLIKDVVDYLSTLNNIKMILAIAGIILIFLNISIAQLTIIRLQKEKTIAFENPNGQVTLSLSAIEDYIRKLSNKIPELKEIKANVIATKTGIEVNTKSIFYDDINIPDATEKIQNLIKIKLQEMLGIEENIVIQIHVAKIVSREPIIKKDKKDKEKDIGFNGEIQY